MSTQDSPYTFPDSTTPPFVTVAYTNASESNPVADEVNAGIESTHSQQFSVAIFCFMLLAIVIFTGIVLGFMRGKTGNTLKTGEKWLFAWIFVGIVVSIIFGGLQLLGGYLF